MKFNVYGAKGQSQGTMLKLIRKWLSEGNLTRRLASDDKAFELTLTLKATKGKIQKYGGNNG